MTDLASLSKWYNEILLAANEGRVEPLAEMLRGPEPLLPVHRAFLADYVEGRLNKQRGRPRKRATDFLRRPPNPVKAAVCFAERYKRVWRKRYGLKNTLTRLDGTRVSLVEEACRKGAERVKIVSGGAFTPGHSAVLELYRRPKDRQRN